MRDYAKYMDHTVLKVDTSLDTVKRFCDEAKEYKFASVCVQPCNVAFVAKELQGSSVKTCTTIGFPFGANTTKVKAFEAQNAIEDGAQEIDMVLNVGRLIDGQDAFVEEDIRAVVAVCHPRAMLKVILETSVLNDEQIVRACQICMRAGADFVKTSTGFANGGATVHAVKLMKETVGDACQVKASTGINDRAICDAMIEAGASRMGTSKGILIIKGE